MTSWPWSTLGIDATDDKSAIRKAYAAKLKSLDIDNEINAFADLRAARDHALSNVGSNVGSDDGDDEDFTDDDLFQIEFNADDLANFGFDPFGAPALNSFGQGHVPDSGPDLGVLSGADEENPLGEADKALTQLLFPGGEHSDEPLEWEEFEQVQSVLEKVLDYAGHAELQTEQAIDFWLSDLLAEAWPRSAPLVEQASEAFGWMREEGQLTERPALAWLNARLGGMRYYDAIQKSGHQDNATWEYLCEPGAYRWWHRMQPGVAGAQEFIRQLRLKYPELESYLEPSKVSALEEGATDFMPGLIRLLFVLFLISIPLRMCDGSSGDSGDPPAISVEQDSSTVVEQAQARNMEFISELFGPEATLVQFVLQDGELARRVQNHALDDFLDRGGSNEPIDIAISEVRARVLGASPSAEFEELVAIKQLKLDLLRAARSAGGNTCRDFMQGEPFDPAIQLEEVIRERERTLAWTLLQQGLFDPEAISEATTSASVPGEIIGMMMESTGYSRVQVSAGLTALDAPESCNVQIASLGAILRRPGEVSAELLRLR